MLIYVFSPRNLCSDYIIRRESPRLRRVPFATAAVVPPTGPVGLVMTSLPLRRASQISQRILFVPDGSAPPSALLVPLDASFAPWPRRT